MKKNNDKFLDETKIEKLNDENLEGVTGGIVSGAIIFDENKAEEIVNAAKSAVKDKRSTVIGSSGENTAKTSKEDIKKSDWITL